MRPGVPDARARWRKFVRSTSTGFDRISRTIVRGTRRGRVAGDERGTVCHGLILFRKRYWWIVSDARRKGVPDPPRTYDPGRFSARRAMPAVRAPRGPAPRDAPRRERRRRWPRRPAAHALARPAQGST